jgi:tRNA-2-methylthio-N6-dimethylallyladenosine synthase
VAKKFYIKTFGCQMNEYDSDRMADVLAAEGIEKTDSPEDADVILFNTCSVREKAQEKVFHDLGRVRLLKQSRPDLVIGVGGCVASQEGEAIVRRAPYVDVVFGPQTLHRLPQLIRAPRLRAAAGGHLLPRDREVRCPAAGAGRGRLGLRVDHGRLQQVLHLLHRALHARRDEVSRPLDDVLAEIAGLAAQGVGEVTLLGQNVNAWRGAMADGGEARPTSPSCSSACTTSPASSASATPPRIRAR